MTRTHFQAIFSTVSLIARFTFYWLIWPQLGASAVIALAICDFFHQWRLNMAISDAVNQKVDR